MALLNGTAVAGVTVGGAGCAKNVIENGGMLVAAVLSTSPVGSYLYYN